MNLNYFNDLVKIFPLQPIFIDYIGSFNPSLPLPKYKYGNPLQFLTKSCLYVAKRVRKFEGFDHFNHKWVSSNILSIYRKIG